MKIISYCLVTGIFFITCKKDAVEMKGCWDVYDPNGYEVIAVDRCDKTRTAVEIMYPDSWIYSAAEQKYCYRAELNGIKFYIYGVPQLVIDRHKQLNSAIIFTRLLDCSSYCTLVWWERHKSKITNEYKPIKMIKETIESKDSCSKLRSGHIVVIRETLDSIITRELHLKTQ